MTVSPACREFSFAPHYHELQSGLRLHSLAKARAMARPCCCCMASRPGPILWRHMILAFVARGHRVLVPDLIGFVSTSCWGERAIPMPTRSPDLGVGGSTDLSGLTLGAARIGAR